MYWSSDSSDVDMETGALQGLRLARCFFGPCWTADFLCQEMGISLIKAEVVLCEYAKYCAHGNGIAARFYVPKCQRPALDLSAGV